MQVACPGCPTDTFRETLKPPNKVRLREGGGARSGLAPCAGVDGGRWNGVGE